MCLALIIFGYNIAYPRNSSSVVPLPPISTDNCEFTEVELSKLFAPVHGHLPCIFGVFVEQ